VGPINLVRLLPKTQYCLAWNDDGNGEIAFFAENVAAEQFLMAHPPQIFLSRNKTRHGHRILCMVPTQAFCMLP
jgi:hypothetical protein